MVQAVIFDFDGVLVESVNVKTEAFGALYEPYGRDVVDRVIAHHLEHGGVSRMEKFRHYHSAFLGCELGDDDLNGLCDRFSELVELRVVAAPFVEGARELLDDLHGVLPMYIASGTPEIELKRIVEQRGMAAYFRGVYGSPRAKSDCIRTVLETGGFHAQDVLMVGDAMTDYHAACDTGVRFIGRIDTAGANPFPADIPVVTTLHELRPYLTSPEGRDRTALQPA